MPLRKEVTLLHKQVKIIGQTGYWFRGWKKLKFKNLRWVVQRNSGALVRHSYVISSFKRYSWLYTGLHHCLTPRLGKTEFILWCLRRPKWGCRRDQAFLRRICMSLDSCVAPHYKISLYSFPLPMDAYYLSCVVLLTDELLNR